MRRVSSLSHTLKLFVWYVVDHFTNLVHDHLTLSKDLNLLGFIFGG